MLTCATIKLAMASKRKFDNKHIDDSPYRIESQILFSEPPDYNTNKSAEELKIVIQQDTEEFVEDSQDYTCCDSYSDNEDNRCESTKEPERKKKCSTQTGANIMCSSAKINKGGDDQNESKENDQGQNSVSCVHCYFDKELDKRNYNFGNLLICELQFLPPCMRSEAYIQILKYVNSLKKRHKDEHNN